MARLHMLPGDRFGRLVLLSKIVTRNPYSYKWYCQCDCGEHVIVVQVNLRTGNTSSCGCLRLERLHQALASHEKSGSLIYKTWNNMIQRCTNPHNSSWMNYGGRGISICHRWLSFTNFYHDMGEPPDEYTLERKNNNGNYSPENCKWASRKEQSVNKRNNRMITFNDTTQSLIQWSEQINIPYWTLHARIRRHWSIKRALTQKVRR